MDQDHLPRQQQRNNQGTSFIATSAAWIGVSINSPRMSLLTNTLLALLVPLKTSMAFCHRVGDPHVCLLQSRLRAQCVATPPPFPILLLLLLLLTRTTSSC